MGRALKFIHSGDIIHRDIKPSNLLLNSECKVKIGDFGLARSLIQYNYKEPNVFLTDYVATRWYRAPEIILGSTNYTKSIDIWSCGCILGELITGKPMFPGSSTVNQLDIIIEFVEKIDTEDLNSIDSLSAKLMIKFVKDMSKIKKEYLKYGSKNAFELLVKLLQFNSKKRITAEKALWYSYMAQFHNPNNEPISSRIIISISSENQDFTTSDYRKNIYKEILKRKKEILKKTREYNISIKRIKNFNNAY